MTDSGHLELLRAEHAEALERFERENRAFFAAHVGDRGDDYFRDFPDRLAGLLREAGEGRSLFFVIVDVDGAVLGRVNVTDIDDPDRTELGFRVAESVQGRGVATAGVAEAMRVARSHNVQTVMARASAVNHGSRGVLVRCGFEESGPVATPPGADGAFIGYRLDLTSTAQLGVRSG